MDYVYYYIWSTSGSGWLGKMNTFTTDLTDAKQFKENEAFAKVSKSGTDATTAVPKLIATPVGFVK